MGKNVIIGGRIHNPEVGNVAVGANEVLDDTKGKKQNVINTETDAELLRLDNEKQDNLSFDNTPTENSTNPITSGGVYASELLIHQAIEMILALIPSAASALNQLADKSFVNSTVATATATFRGTYNVVTDLGLEFDATHEQIAAALLSHIATADNNDYAFVQIPVSATSTDIRVTERYKFNGTAWAYEYDLNNSGFTALQWAAINSGITALLVEKLGALPTAAELALALAGKQATLTFDNVPVAGSNNPVKSGGLYELFAAIDAKMPAGASANNKLVAEDRLAAYVAAIIGALDASYNVTSSDGHVTVKVTQADGAITSVEVLTSDIASASALSTLTGRVSTNETDIATLQALYNALLQSAPQIIEPTDTWPVASPSGTVIYRVIDRVNTPPQYYSDYMWNGTAMVLMAQYNNAIDNEPIAGSNNLVKSGGVYPSSKAVLGQSVNESFASVGEILRDNLSAGIGVTTPEFKVTTNKAKASITGYINNITLNTRKAGTYKVGLGTIDSNKNIYIRDTFDINVPNESPGINQTVNILDLHKTIQQNEYLFIWVNAYDQGTNISQRLESLSAYVIVSTDTNVAEDVTAVYISLAFDIINISHSLFAEKDDIKPIDTLLFNGDSDIIKKIGSSDFLADRTIGTTLSTVKYTAKKSKSTIDGILKDITVNTTIAGTYKMGVGYIDQRGLVMMRETFDINVPLTTTENQTIDVQDKNIKIHVDDYVWMWINAYNQGTNCRNYGAPDHSTVLENYIIACGADEYIDESLKYVYFQLTYSVLENNSVFALKADVEEVNEIANSALNVSNDALSKVGIVYDENFNPYKLKIINNELIYVPVYKQNVLVIGNSYSYHYTIASLGWYLTAGMAATKLENDFVHQLQGILRTKINDAIATAYWNGTDSGYWIERQSNEDHIITDEEFATFFAANLVQKNWDAIVFEIQSNVSSSHINSFITNISNCIDWIRSSQYASADIYMVVMDSDKQEQILQLISEKKIGKVVIEHPRNNYMYLQQYGYYYWGDDTQEYPIISAGVKGHINDLGMLYLANQIAVAMGYDAAGKTHNISIGSSGDYLAPSIGVESGLITILTYGNSAPSVTITSDGNPVNYTIHDLSQVTWIDTPPTVPTYAITFVMPNSDVIANLN